VDVELHNAGAPPGSLKSLSPPTAAYTPGGTAYTDVNGLPYTLGSCANVYCHSATEWSYPGVVSAPLMDPINGWAALDANGNLTYQPYTVGVSSGYATVNWGGLPQGCNDCHRNMPQTSVPGLQAGVGNSHGWIDDWGYENYHAWNMGFDPLTCRVCHYDTVKNDMTWTRDGMGITFFDDVAIDDKTYHVNGVKDVRFDTLDPVIYPTSGGTVTFSLAATTYSPQTKVCSNTPCHLEQTSPEWGKPYRWWNSLECDQCHRYGGPWPPPAPNAVAQGNEKGRRMPTSRLSVYHSESLAESCTECHVGHQRTP
jgi:hypothetical protein